MQLKKFEIRIEAEGSGAFLVMTRRQAFDLYGLEKTTRSRLLLYKDTFKKIARKHLKFYS